MTEKSTLSVSGSGSMYPGGQVDYEPNYVAPVLSITGDTPQYPVNLPTSTDESAFVPDDGYTVATPKLAIKGKKKKRIHAHRLKFTTTTARNKELSVLWIGKSGRYYRTVILAREDKAAKAVQIHPNTGAVIPGTGIVPNPVTPAVTTPVVTTPVVASTTVATVVPLTNSQVTALTDTQIQTLTTDQINTLTPDQIGLLTPSQSASLDQRKTTLATPAKSNMLWYVVGGIIALIVFIKLIK